MSKIVSVAWLDEYIDAWALHAFAGGPDGDDVLARLLGCMSPEVSYEDVPSRRSWDGDDGVARMCHGAYELSHDLRFTITTRLTDGRHFAFESIGTGTHTGAFGGIVATGRPITFRGCVCVGEVTADGLVRGHRDYWDMADLLRQLRQQ
jgi:predicted ester cyclase